MPDTTITTPPVAPPNGTLTPPAGGERVEGLVAELVADWAWFYDRANDGQFDQYAGEHVAVYRKVVVDHDADRVALVDRASAALGVPPNHIIYPYVEPPIWEPESA